MQHAFSSHKPFTAIACNKIQKKKIQIPFYFHQRPLCGGSCKNVCDHRFSTSLPHAAIAILICRRNQSIFVSHIRPYIICSVTLALEIIKVSISRSALRILRGCFFFQQQHLIKLFDTLKHQNPGHRISNTMTTKKNFPKSKLEIFHYFVQNFFVLDTENKYCEGVALMLLVLNLDVATPKLCGRISGRIRKFRNYLSKPQITCITIHARRLHIPKYREQIE